MYVSECVYCVLEEDENVVFGFVSVATVRPTWQLSQFVIILLGDTVVFPFTICLGLSLIHAHTHTHTHTYTHTHIHLHIANVLYRATCYIAYTIIRELIIWCIYVCIYVQ